MRRHWTARMTCISIQQFWGKTMLFSINWPIIELIISSSCAPCQNGTASSSDHLQCVCPKSSRIVNISPRGFECKPCRQGRSSFRWCSVVLSNFFSFDGLMNFTEETVSLDGSTCMQCRSGNCNCNSESEILRNGQCEACQNGEIFH